MFSVPMLPSAVEFHGRSLDPPPAVNTSEPAPIVPLLPAAVPLRVTEPLTRPLLLANNVCVEPIVNPLTALTSRMLPDPVAVIVELESDALAPNANVPPLT